jgi:predicted RND superfamily exporter protein
MIVFLLLVLILFLSISLIELKVENRETMSSEELEEDEYLNILRRNKRRKTE